MYTFIISIDSYEECQPSVKTDQPSQQLNKRATGTIIMSYLVLLMRLKRVSLHSSHDTVQ